MSKISSSKKVILEELPADTRSWFTKVTAVINPFFEQVYQILTQGITIADNFKAQKIATDIEIAQVYPISIKYTLTEAPYALHLASIKEDVSSNQVVQNFSYNWYYVNGELKIYFTGLDAAKKYTANFYTLI